MQSWTVEDIRESEWLLMLVLFGFFKCWKMLKEQRISWEYHENIWIWGTNLMKIDEVCSEFAIRVPQSTCSPGEERNTRRWKVGISSYDDIWRGGVATIHMASRIAHTPSTSLVEAISATYFFQPQMRKSSRLSLHDWSPTSFSKTNESRNKYGKSMKIHGPWQSNKIQWVKMVKHGPWPWLRHGPMARHDPTKHWWQDVLLPRALRFLARRAWGEPGVFEQPVIWDGGLGYRYKQHDICVVY